MKTKSSYKSQMKADRKRGQKQKQKQKAQRNCALNWLEIGEMEWMGQVGCALVNDDVEALKILVQDRRFSIFDIQVDLNLDDGGVAPDQPLLVVASHVGAAKCLEHLCFIAAAADNVGALSELHSDLYARYESEEGDKRELERMILAVMGGAERGYEGLVPGIYLNLSLKFPNATRFAMTSMADRHCGAVNAPAYQRAHIENKRQLFAAMALGDAEAVDIHLRRTQANLQQEGLVIGDSEVKRIFQVAAACERPESIAAAFKTMRGLQDNTGQKGAVLALLMASFDELAPTVNKVGMPWIDKVVKDCVELAVIEDRELGETILDKADKMFFYTVEAAKSGALAALAELERRELASHAEMYEVIERVSSTLRV